MAISFIKCSSVCSNAAHPPHILVKYSEVYGGFIKDHDMLYCFNVFLMKFEFKQLH